ncbi:MAG TPA: ABC transporter substrate-binding protein [Acidobacteriota bacterium]|nr:ABC transporter substrate-binding protein [Acidobacteriota bacterium]
MRTSTLLLALLAVGLVAGCGKKTETDSSAASATNHRTKIRFQTDWFPQPEHGGYYQAVARGYYAEEGLDVEIVRGGPNAQVMASVATGRAQIGMTNGDDTIVAIGRGVPIKMVAAEMQRDAQGILYHNENPIRDLRDLDGKTIMAGAGSIWLQVAQKKLGIRFNIQPLVGDLGRFMNDKKFIQQCFVTNEPFFVRQRGADAGALLIARPGEYEPYRVIFTSEAFLVENPEAVRRFVRASIRGWIDYLTSDPSPGNKLIKEARTDLPDELFAYSIKAMKDYQLVLGDPARGEKMGQLTAARLETQLKLLNDLGFLERPLTVKDVATFELLPPESR